MSALEIHGVYKDGKIELDALPPDIHEAKVRVLFEAVDVDSNARFQAGRELMQLLKAGMPLGGPPYPRREELYDRDIGRGTGTG